MTRLWHSSWPSNITGADDLILLRDSFIHSLVIHRSQVREREREREEERIESSEQEDGAKSKEGASFISAFSAFVSPMDEGKLFVSPFYSQWPG